VISLELSTVQQNREQSASIDAAVAAFLAKGGEIQTLSGFPARPEPNPTGAETQGMSANLHRVGGLKKQCGPQRHKT